MSNFFRFNFTKETAVAFLAGFAMIALSLLMIPFGGKSTVDLVMSFLLRDALMIFGLGVVFVSLFLEKGGEEAKAELGFSRRKPKLSFALNVVFAACLLGVFLKEEIPQNILALPNLYAAVYILVAGIFEMTFIYGFLRMSFEKAFGIVPAILLTAAFYSFHHAGFQPEFFHLFFVGVMYTAVYYITQNLLIVFPFFWAVGALWDVIVSSNAGGEIKNIESFASALIVLALSAGWLLFRKYGRKN